MKSNVKKNRFLRATVIIAIFYSPMESKKIPEWEMDLSAGAVCQNVIIASQSYKYAA